MKSTETSMALIIDSLEYLDVNDRVEPLLRKFDGRLIANAAHYFKLFKRAVRIGQYFENYSTVIDFIESITALDRNLCKLMMNDLYKAQVIWKCYDGKYKVTVHVKNIQY
jgi:hypothetical protein